jgi:hypothetical protein
VHRFDDLLARGETLADELRRSRRSRTASRNARTTREFDVGLEQGTADFAERFF